MRTLRIDGDKVIAGGHKYQELDRFIVRMSWARHQHQARVWSAAYNARRQGQGLLCHLNRANYTHRDNLHVLIGWECRVRGCVHHISVILVSPTQGFGDLRPAGNPSLYIFVAGGCSVTTSSGNHKQYEGRAHAE